MPRPKKADHDRRDEWMGVRFSPDERLQVEAAAAKAGKPPSEYVRTQALQGRVVVEGHRALEPAVFDELKRIGNNLNQMVRRAHATGEESPALLRLYEELQDFFIRELPGYVRRKAYKGSDAFETGQYHLHDKKGAQTAERVAWTHTRNLPTDDPHLAIKFMADTISRAGELKAAAGKSRGGQKQQHPMYTVAITWHPEETPSREEMIAAGEWMLKHMGWLDYEVLMVAHNDEPQPHVHVIVNRVHPRTGLMADLSNDHLRLSRWAQAWTKERGKDLCPQRVINNKLRDEGKFVKYRPAKNKADHHRAKNDNVKRRFDARAEGHLRLDPPDIRKVHTTQQQALYDEKELNIKHIQWEIRTAHKPRWAELYKRQRQEKRELNQMQKTASTRLLYHLRQHRAQTGIRRAIKDAVRALWGRDNPHGQLARKHEAEREALAKEITQLTRQAMREENQRYRDELAQLKRLQRAERLRLRTMTREAGRGLDVERAARVNREHQEEHPEEAHRDEPQRLQEEFRKAARDRIRRARKRDERGKGKDLGRERE